jgi:hypothetical protein
MTSERGNPSADAASRSERERARERRETSHRHHDRAIDEQSDDDRRRAEKDVVDKADHRRETVVPAVFGKIGARKQADRRADANPDHGHDDGTDDGVHKTALGRAWRRRVLSEKLPTHPGKPIVE